MHAATLHTSFRHTAAEQGSYAASGVIIQLQHACLQCDKCCEALSDNTLEQRHGGMAVRVTVHVKES